MEYRNLSIEIVSANNLPNVRSMGGQMRVYAVVSCSRNSYSYRTKIDMENGRHPRWRDKSFNFWIDEESVQKPGTHVVVRLYCKRTFLRDKPVGDEVAIEVKKLYDEGVRAKNNVPYPVPEAKGGTLNISYEFGKVYGPKQRGLANWQKIFGCGISACGLALPSVFT